VRSAQDCSKVLAAQTASSPRRPWRLSASPCRLGLEWIAPIGPVVRRTGSRSRTGRARDDARRGRVLEMLASQELTVIGRVVRSHCCRSVADFGNPTFIECSQLNRRSPCRFGKSNGGASLAIPMKCIRSDGCGYRRDFSGSIIQIVRLRRLRGRVKARAGSGVDVVFQPTQVSSRSLHCRAKERFHGKTRTENHARRNARIRRSRATDLLL
jgi:hypothetical protein